MKKWRTTKKKADKLNVLTIRSICGIILKWDNPRQDNILRESRKEKQYEQYQNDSPL